MDDALATEEAEEEAVFASPAYALEGSAMMGEHRKKARGKKDALSATLRGAAKGSMFKR